MPRPVEGSSPYNAGLDGIRAVAVLGVVAYHLGLGWASGGLLGVGVFFVLSGYLITDLLVAAIRKRGAQSFGQFWVRRARRLLPALFVVLLVTVAWATLLDRSQLPALRGDVLPAVFYYSNWWYIFHHVSYFAEYGPPSPLGHLWSLAIEEQFYLFWPFAVLAALRWVRDRRALVVGCLVLAAGSAIDMALLFSPYADPTRVYDGTDTRAFELLVGAALALVWPRSQRFAPITARARTLLEVTGGVALVGIVVLYWQTSQYDPFVYRGGMALLSVLSAVLIAVCIHPGARVARVLGVGPLRWIGERSYGIYLWSLPVIVLTTPQGSKENLLRDALQVAGIVGAAALSWRFVEQPVRHGALGRHWHALRDRWRAKEWGGLVPGTQGWAATGAVLVAGLICALGLSGVITGAPRVPEASGTILPRRHYVQPATTDTLPHDPPGQGTATTTTTTLPAGTGVTVIGDSIMVDAAPYIQQLLPNAKIDAQVGQQLYQIQSEVPQLESQGDVGNELILELGTNGYYSATQLEALLRSLGPMRHIVLVNTRETRPWEEAVNQNIATVARTYPDTTMVDWYDISASTPQYFYPDGVHLDPQGAQFYASLLVHALESPPPSTGSKSTGGNGAGGKGATGKGATGANRDRASAHERGRPPSR
ncbi:MAG TPA: acyltransferase family protein [Acidimicrobiales bacterium]|nr:acyltransferase family protein [Acidimicrobiales bacterium]